MEGRADKMQTQAAKSWQPVTGSDMRLPALSIACAPRFSFILYDERKSPVLH
jgi:hypothetical protein